MKTRIDDTELAGLESRLRRSVAGHAPDAPDSLLRFIDTVPVFARAARRPELIHVGLRVRRSFVAMATVAAVIVAIVAAAAFVSVRNGRVGPTSNVASSPSVPGWSWQRADGSFVERAFKVPNGYMGECGNPDRTLCSSPDGLHWTTPADPRIVSVEGSGQFRPQSLAEYNGNYVAAVLSTDVANPQDIPLWRSTDGVHWSQVASTGFSGLIGVLPGGFVATAIPGQSDETGWALTSTDGLSWKKASRLPVAPNFSTVGSAGLFVGSAIDPTKQWRTLDGSTWALAETPVGMTGVRSYAIPGGGFVGIGFNTIAVGDNIVRSVDGQTWTADQGDLQGVPVAVVVVGDRLIADVSAGNLNSSVYPDASAFAENAFAVWQSTDWGRTWQPVVDPTTGHQMQGLVQSLSDSLAVCTPDMATTSWTITWVGTPTDSAMPILSPAPATTPPSGATSLPTAIPSATAAPSEPAPTSIPIESVGS